MLFPGQTGHTGVSRRLAGNLFQKILIFLLQFSRACDTILEQSSLNAFPGVAQLVACLNGVQEAGRSNRPTRTKEKSSKSKDFGDFSLVFDGNCSGRFFNSSTLLKNI